MPSQADGPYGGGLRMFASMAAPRLSDSQKEQLVERYRQGQTAQALADSFGCSPNTVSRVLKAAMDPEELAAVKQQRGRPTVSAPASAKTEPQPDPAPVAPPVEVAPVQADLELDDGSSADPEADRQSDAEETHLAIDDADDFGDDGLDDDSADDADFNDAFVAVPVAASAVASLQPLQPGLLPLSVYMLVDKTVELQPKPLREFPELGTLPEEEQERQGLMLYSNPRQAKRQCGRSQRVIKVPDSGVLERTSSYLVAQGITRLVVEGGALYSLPGC